MFTAPLVLALLALVIIVITVAKATHSTVQLVLAKLMAGAKTDLSAIEARLQALEQKAVSAVSPVTLHVNTAPQPAATPAPAVAPTPAATPTASTPPTLASGSSGT